MTTSTILPITTLPQNLPLDGAIAIALQDNVMIFRASSNIQQRIENLSTNAKKPHSPPPKNKN